jgi:hypothetical protein
MFRGTTPFPLRYPIAEKRLIEHQLWQGRALCSFVYAIPNDDVLQVVGLFGLNAGTFVIRLRKKSDLSITNSGW